MEKRGFTLVEVLVSLAILGIGILGVTLMVPRALEQGRRAVALTRAANQAETMFSRYRAKGFRTMFGVPQRFRPPVLLPDITEDAIRKSAEIYRFYGWEESPLAKSKIKFTELHFARSAGLYKMTISVPLVGGGNSSYVTYLARE